MSHFLRNDSLNLVYLYLIAHVEILTVLFVLSFRIVDCRMEDAKHLLDYSFNDNHRDSKRQKRHTVKSQRDFCKLLIMNYLIV